MSYEYNPKGHYAPYSKHRELITQKDLTQLFITVQDDNQISSGFDVNVPEAIFDLRVYKYYKHGDSGKSSWNWNNNPLRLWEVQLNFAVHCATSALGISTEHLNAK